MTDLPTIQRLLGFTVQGVAFVPCPHEGCFYNADRSLAVAMLTDGTPDTYNGEPNVILVTDCARCGNAPADPSGFYPELCPPCNEVTYGQELADD